MDYQWLQQMNLSVVWLFGRKVSCRWAWWIISERSGSGCGCGDETCMMELSLFTELTFLPSLRQEICYLLSRTVYLKLLICDLCMITLNFIWPGKNRSVYVCSTKLGCADWSSYVLYTRDVGTSYVRPVQLSRMQANRKMPRPLTLIVYRSSKNSMLLF